MNKILNILINTVVPVTIGTTVFVGCFWLIDKHTLETDVKDCEVYNLSNTFYLVSIFVIVAITTFYQLTIAELLNRHVNNKGFSSYIIKILAFALFISVASLLILLVNGKPEAMVAVNLFLMGCMLGVINTLSYFVCRKLIPKIFSDKQ
ncbi:hypothetical protein A3860_26365 [Niastella vici]|uniref:DUF2975 domain-containing protein n=2 Tax=Niastella vici TaxID=1703345 RepID=A0A1V9FWU4_9BACT|nr:hypothetical protein A3860_26365 [Niastella vici]